MRQAIQGELLTDGEAYPVRPEHINGEAEHFWNAFENMETEVSAKWLVRFVQARGRGWVPFSLKEIQAFYSEHLKSASRFTFNRLIEPEMAAFGGPFGERRAVGGGWIIRDAAGRYFFTTDFVDRCFRSAKAPSVSASL